MQAAKRRGWITYYMSQYRWQFAAAAVLGAIAILSAAALLFTSGYLISRSSLQPENILMVYVPIVLVRTFGFSKAIFQYLERLAGHSAALRILASMRTRLYRIVEPQALRMRSKYKSGDLLGLLAEDIEQLQNIFLRIVLPALSSLIVYGAVIALLGRFDLWFALLMALYSGIWLFIAPLAALWLSVRRRKQYKQQRNRLYTQLTDAIYGMSDWQLSGRAGQFLDDYEKQSSAMNKLEQQLRRSEWRWQLVTRSSAAAAVIMMAIWAAGMVEQGLLLPSFIAAMALVALPLMDAFVKVGDSVYRIPDYKDSMNRLNKLEQSGQSRWDDASARDEKAAEEAIRAALPKSVNRQSIDIALQQVSFQYEGSHPLTLKQIDLNIPQGSNMAVLGRSGAGKSTLLNLMLGELKPSSGEVTLNGITAGELDAADFSVLNQKPYLFDTSVANNIRLGKPDASDEEVQQVTEQVGLGSFIASLPNGYNTRMEEMGQRFSGGERQRIALARILLQNRPIVLLDEPTVGLDSITERKLVNTIFATLKGKTLIWFTHHLIGMEQMDEIVFMEQGRIVMRGSHEELLEREPKYRRLYELDQL